MNVLIDCGTYKGRSLQTLRQKYSGFKSYAFEPIKKHIQEIRSKNPDTIIINKAVWISNIRKRIYIGKSEGTSLYKSKHTDGIGKHGSEVVECIDFSLWIKNNFKKADFIILKMDIEGAEYPILEKMIKDDTIKYINVLYCEWHYNKIKVISKEYHNNLLKKLREIGNVIKGWK